ncbi:MAG TPA: ABC transporter permease [Candidatus Dormibacteraeota bacterium]|jgi:oligopeptide transport system permease protein|nr:ABC transporter permease [Candidatus Dormibacteraeota bacterium]
MRGTLLYIGQRLVLIAITTVLVSSIVFLLLHQIPGNAFLNETRQTPQTLAAELHHYGLDLPLQTQYANYVKGVIHGDLGESLVNRGVKIMPLLIRETTVSATVGFFAILITIGLGLILGTIAALRQNTWIDYIATSASVVGYSIPNFVLAIFGLLLFGHYLYIWTGGAFFYEPGWGKPEQIPVPALALGLPFAAYVARLTRASMLETIRTDYVRTAWAKGLKSRVVVFRHALRNALIPVVTILGPLITGIITGSVVIENTFGIPGLGKEFITSILARDYNIVIGVFTFYAALVGLANLTVDVIYPVLDPRIRY